MSRRSILTSAGSVLLPLALGACSGGGGNGGGTAAVGLRLDASGVAAPLWQGTTVGPPACGGPVFQNSRLVFTFGGPVDPASVPSSVTAQGPVRIVTASGTPLAGALAVEDDPALPAGNRRRVVLEPVLPATAAALTTTGIVGPAVFLVVVPAAGSPGPLLTIGGQPLSAPIVTCFTACDPGTSGCFTDNDPGPPYAATTAPETFDPPPPGLSRCAIPGQRVSVQASEPLRPGNIDTGTVRLRNTSTGAQVPGQVVFFQAGTPEAGPAGARFDYVLAGPPPAGATFELTLDPAITDFAGNPIAAFAPGAPSAPPSGRRLLATAAEPLVAQPPVVDDLSTTANRASVSGAALWAGDGVVTVRAPDDFVGNGAFGPLTFGPGPGTLDPGQPPILVGGQVAFADGTWNFSVLTIALGANVRCTGHAAGNPRRIHLRCTGSAIIDGTLNANAGTQVSAPIGTTEQGARPGQFNNGNPGNPQWVAGGVGGSGGGRGGHASQADIVGPAARTGAGEAGFGPPVDGLPNAGPAGANPLYGGGAGGFGGFLFPQGGANGDLGGLGGAGGSAFTAGENGGPNAIPPNCTALPTALPRALAPAPPAAFVADPISVASAGSGGGGGGDHFDPAGVANDDQGGGGGGGGGGIRISALGDVAFGAGAAITANGGTGGAGNVFQGGHGGGGSGGEIWVQSAGQIVIAASTNLQVNGGNVNTVCGNQAAGRGAIGVYQFEDSDGLVNTAFTGIPAGGGNVLVAPFPFTTTVTGVAISTFFDTGYGAPDYVSAAATSAPGSLAGAAVAVAWQGAHEAVSGGLPDLATLSAPVTAAQIDQIDGHRFVRFVITITYPLFPLPPPGAAMPSVDDVTFAYRIPAACP